ncbi:DeoR/GlpR family DNA-binding transcription regulator [Ensifer soli]|uniref:DeoR/GlpR family DNA-binding transcription regulator n=1 Tax=Ciceribacter sp. sgz301302 TaxID=3342379 RepID=UPI0035B82B24
MLTSQRRALITARLSRDGEVVAKALSEELALSEDTIRRDLREMAAEGLLRRVHGGALPLEPALPDFSERRAIGADVKQALGRKGAELIRPGQLVFLDGGTTNAALARALPRDMKATIATHSPTIAAELERHAAEVILVGGVLYKHSMVAVGSLALSAIATMRPDLFFLGVTGLHPVSGLTTGDMEEAAIKRAIAGQAAETVLLAAADKFDAVSPHRIMATDRLSRLIVPEGLEDAALAPYRALGIAVMPA